MINENARMWVNALRSGAFTQGKGSLRNQSAYCCLGVACVLAEKEGVISPTEWIGHSYLPSRVRDWLGLQERAGFISSMNTSLAYLNDRNKSFKEIADVIESDPKGLFA
jgi:hypothetical protein